MLGPSHRAKAAFLLVTALLASVLVVPGSAQPPGDDGRRDPVPAPRRGVAVDVRDPIDVEAFSSLRSPAAAGVLHVKLAEGSDVRVEGGQVVGAGLARLTRALRRADATTAPLFARARRQLRAERRDLRERSGAEPVDLTLWLRVEIGDRARAQRLMDTLNALDLVEAALPEPQLAPATHHGAEPSPDFEPNQTYRDPAPDGVDADYAAGVAGGTGSAVTLTDVEYSWNTDHEDLTGTGTRIANGEAVDPFGPDHGTAVLGIVAGGANGFGVTGLVPDVATQLVNVFTDQGQALTNALDIAAANSEPGDVIVVQQQLCPETIVAGICPSGWLPVEWFPSFYDAIVAAVGRGIHVIEPAGNGARDVDLHLRFPDSGAIMVGAGNGPGCLQFGPEPAQGRLDFSNYGERVDVQAHGGCIWTTGQEGGGTSGDPDRSYTGRFNGTSGAAAIVAGAAASLASVSATSGDPLEPHELRALLRSTGTPQSTVADPRPIGPQPDLRAAIDAHLGGGVPGPANDDYFTPTPLDLALPLTVEQRTLGASVQVGEPVGSCGFPDRTVWFRLEPERDVEVSFRARGRTRTPSLTVWRRVGPDRLQQLGCDRDGGLVDAPLEAGETYLVQVGNGGGEAITLAMTGAAGCDLNADGYGDVLLGAPGEGIRGAAGAGAVVVYYGHARGRPDRAPLLSAATTRVAGAAEPGDGFGTSVACGDVDGDGYDDALVGIPGEDRRSKVDVGAAHIFYGAPDGLSGRRDRLFTQASGSIPGRPEPGDRFGATVALADLNGDGYDDAVVGTPDEGVRGRSRAGIVTVVYGSPEGLDLLSGAMVHQGTAGVPGAVEAGDRMGGALAVGDVDGDGYDDVAVGVAGESLGGIDRVGAVIVIPGGPGGPDLATSGFYAPGQARVATPSTANLAFGSAVALGDLTGDGRLDLAVGSLAGGGRVDVLRSSASGRFGGGVGLDRATPGVPGQAAAGDRFGGALAIADTDGAGPGELHIGARGVSAGASRDGMVVAVALGPSLALQQVTAYSQATPGVAGAPENGDRMGAALGVEDVDGDGYPDLIVGHDGEGVAGRRRAGAVNLLPGSAAGLDPSADRLIHQGSQGVGGAPERGDRLGAASS